MNIIFLSQVEISDLDDRNIYTDLIRTFLRNGHHVTIFSAVERRNYKSKIQDIITSKYEIYKLKTFNLQKTSAIEKVLGHLSFDGQLLRKIKDKLSKQNYDTVLYYTPPITITKTLKYLKDEYNCYRYLWIKDIFPQNALDLGLISKYSPIYRFFKAKERSFYKLSDRIGCMSEANMNYLLKHNPNEVWQVKVEVNYNCIDLTMLPARIEQDEIRKKHQIPLDKKVFIYGGNIGKPQGVDFIISLLGKMDKNENAYFIIVGSGTEFGKLENWYKRNNPPNIRLINFLPRAEFDLLVSAADVGLIFLDHRFTIPNFPSRLLSYLEYAKPVLVFSDENTDVGIMAENNGFGSWAMSNDVDKGLKLIEEYATKDSNELKAIGEKGYEYMIRHFSSETSYKQIVNAVKESKSKI